MNAFVQPPFELNPRQMLANEMLASRARHIMLRGGSRSGKTFLLCRAILIRAAKAKGSRHTILRSRFNHLKASIIADTMPKVIKLCFEKDGMPSHDSMLNKSDWFVQLPNESQIWYGGLDDKERTEKVLGQEHATILLNECSQISYQSRNKAVTRLAQNIGLALKMYYDCNPPQKGHWTYKMFEQGVEPVSGKRLSDEQRLLYATMMLNPRDNPHLTPEYIEELKLLPKKDQLRFLEGQYGEQVDGALWTQEGLDAQRVSVDQLPEMQRVTVNVDPSGCSGPENTRSDEVGMTVTGRSYKKHGYLLDDISGHYKPEKWAEIAVNAYDKWEADTIVAEKNFGGDMVRAVIQAHRPNVPVKLVTASRGKAVRAEPVSALYDQKKIWHLEVFPELEGQLCEFSNAGYMGDTSPDRADSAIWGFTELMLDATKGKAGVLF